MNMETTVKVEQNIPIHASRPHPKLLELRREPGNLQLLQLRHEDTKVTPKLIKVPADPLSVGRLPLLSLGYLKNKTPQKRDRSIPSLIRIPLKDSKVEFPKSKDVPRLLQVPVYSTEEVSLFLLNIPKDHTAAASKGPRTVDITKVPTSGNQPNTLDNQFSDTSNQSNASKLTPLLSHPVINKRRTPLLIRLPLAVHQDVEPQKPVLLQRPMGEENRPLDSKNGIHVSSNEKKSGNKKYVPSVNQDQPITVVSQTLLPKESQLRSSSKRRRRRKRKTYPDVSASEATDANANANRADEFSSSKATVESKPCQKSQETQTFPEQKKRKRKNRRLALMSLLEQASLFSDSGSSADDDLESHLLNNVSNILKDEEYALPEKTPHASRSVKLTPSRNLKLGNENYFEASFDDKNLNDSKPFLDHGEQIQGNSRGTRPVVPSYAKLDINIPSPPKLGQRISKSVQRVDNPAGPSWKDIIALSNASSSSSKNLNSEDKEVQAVEISEQKFVGQEAQTEISLGTDVTSRLLNFYKGNDREPDRTVTLEDPSFVPSTGFVDRQLDSHGSLEERMQNEKMPSLLKHPPESCISEKKVKEAQTKQQYAASVPPEIFLEMNRDHDGSVALSTKAKPSEREFISVVEVMPSQAPTFTLQDNSQADGKLEKSIIFRGHDQVTGQDQFTDETRPVVEIGNRGTMERLRSALERKPFEQMKDNDFAIPAVKSKPSNSIRSILERVDGELESPLTNQRDSLKKEHSAIPDMPTPLTAKGKLNNNLRELSTQLDALDDLHKHLEWELKNSKLLMQTVDTLQQGFLDDEVSSSLREKRQYQQWDGLERAHSKRSNQRRSLWKSSLFSSAENANNEANDHPRANYHLKKMSTGTIEDDSGDNSNHTDNRDLEISVEEIIDENKEPKEQEQDRWSINEGSGSGLELVEKASENVERKSDSIGTHGSRPTSSRVSIGSRRASSQLSVGGSQIPTGNEKLQTTHKIENEIVTPRSPSNKESDIKAKLEKKRKALKEWMKKKRSEQNQKYLEEVGNKRQSEFRPFSGSQNPVTLKDIKANDKKITEKKIVRMEEDFNDRAESAQALMTEIISTKPFSPRPFQPSSSYERRRSMSSARHTNVPKRKGSKNIQKRGKGRGSKLKTDFTSNRFNETENSKYKETLYNDSNSKNIVHRPVDNISQLPSSKQIQRNEHFDDVLYFSSDVKAETQKSTPRRSVEARDFVTSSSYNKYKKKTAILVRDTIRTFTETDNVELDGNLTDSKRFSTSGRHSGFSLRSDQETSYNNRLGTFLKSGNRPISHTTDLNTNLQTSAVDELIMKELLNDKENIRNSLADQNTQRLLERTPSHNFEEEEDINAILLQYGALDDSQMDLLASPETALLLAEADAALESDSEDNRKDAVLQETVDWDEVDRILNEP